MALMDRIERASSRFYDAVRSSKAADSDATATGFEHLRGRKYTLFVSYRRSGEPIATPVWCGLDSEGRAYVRTGKLAAKLKRISANPRVKLAPCTVRGVPTGPFAEGRARVLDAGEEGHAERALQSNYGLFRRIYEGSAGSMDAFYIEVTPDAKTSADAGASPGPTFPNSAG